MLGLICAVGTYVCVLNTVRVLCSNAVCMSCCSAGLGSVLDVMGNAKGIFCIIILCIRAVCSTGGIRAVVCVAVCSMHLCYLAVLVVLGFS